MAIGLKKLGVLLSCAAFAAALAAGAGRLLEWSERTRHTEDRVTTALSPGATAKINALALRAAGLCDQAVREAAERVASGRGAPDTDLPAEPGLLDGDAAAPASDGLAGAADSLRARLQGLELPEGVTLRVSHPACGEALVVGTPDNDLTAAGDGPGGPGEYAAARRFEAVSDLGWTVTVEARPVHGTAAAESFATATQERLALAGLVAGAAALLLALRLAARRGMVRTAKGHPAAAREALPTGSILRLRERYGVARSGLPGLAGRTRSAILRRLIAHVGPSGPGGPEPDSGRPGEAGLATFRRLRPGDAAAQVEGAEAPADFCAPACLSRAESHSMTRLAGVGDNPEGRR